MKGCSGETLTFSVHDYKIQECTAYTKACLFRARQTSSRLCLSYVLISHLKTLKCGIFLCERVSHFKHLIA
jgi:hypothetical protein